MMDSTDYKAIEFVILRWGTSESSGIIKIFKQMQMSEYRIARIDPRQGKKFRKSFSFDN